MMFAVLGLVAGCSSTPNEGPKVEERKPVMADTRPVQPAKPETGPKTAPSRPETVGADPLAALKDPNNILSRRSVYFDYDSNVIKEEFKPLVTAHSNFISQNRSQRMTIQGNTDERGSREYNLALGQRRAEAVKQMMTLLGAPGANIETVSFGEEKPRAQGNDEKAYAENRRADIVYGNEQ
jgi:peptidoglycan-associated lipoprotein